MSNDATTPSFEAEQRIKLPGEVAYVTVDEAIPSADGGWRLYLREDAGIRRVTLTAQDAAAVSVVRQDGGADSASVLAGLWAHWMKNTIAQSRATALASTPLVPYPHQHQAVYDAMLPQPMLRFLLADEPGTGKTIMGGLWLREMQRLGSVKRALVVAPAHLVEKWRKDFDRFLGGGLRRITADTVREGGLSTDHDLWVVSLELAALNPAVAEAIHPDLAGWDAVVFDEAHRLSPRAVTQHRVGRMLAENTPRAVLMTATPHRGNEWLFRALMHLVDPKVFPDVERLDAVQPGHVLRPGRLHFLRRMKEELVDYDGKSPLFKGRRATNVKVPLNVSERTFYNEALGLVEDYFPPVAVALASMVYGKRAASSLHALAETLRRRRDGMGTRNPIEAALEADPDGDDDAERDLARVIHEQSKASKEEKKAIDGLLERIDAQLVAPDLAVSKWPKLVDECLTPNGIAPGNGEQLVVFTEYADTANWLVGRFRAEGYSAQRYSGQDLMPERDVIRTQFMAGEFQVLVSTDAGNEGIDLQTAHVLVNWDIPWSLVRLEQRMGRIHRLGQNRDVELFNLVAVDTREGAAHLVLLENLVRAANELGGKMFDSLSLIGEMAFEDAGSAQTPAKLLARLYQPGAQPTAVLDAMKAITTERLRIAAERARDKEDALASKVDIAAAVASFQDERLERVNPEFVERFLRRLAMARLVTVDKSALADDGLFHLGASGLAHPPKFLGDGLAPVLVATSGKAKRDAEEAGEAEAAKAVGLGPVDPAFRDLVGACVDHLRPALYQGATLHDPTTSTDYDLFAFEVPVSEAGGRRSTTWSYLVRVDDFGARVVSWSLLANLESRSAPPRHVHPGRSVDASQAAQAAAGKARAEREATLVGWLADAREQLERLPRSLSEDIDEREQRVAVRKRLQAAVEERTAKLRSSILIKVGEVHQAGWARVLGSGDAPDPMLKDSEAVSMRHVRALLSAQGWGVTDVHSERPGPGFDLHARKGRIQRCVEVKSAWESAASEGVEITGNEWGQAAQLGDDYWIYVVDRCFDGVGTLFATYQNPVAVFGGALQDVAVFRIRGSDLKAAKEAQVA